MLEEHRSVSDDWFRPRDVSPGSTTRLFLLHHAGGTAATYAAWSSLFPADIAVQAIQLPGRHDRPGEPPHTRVEPLVAALREALLGELDDRPYALFGHSMGALIGYRLAVAMDSAGDPAPVMLGVSAFSRGFRTDELPGEEESDGEVLAKISKLGVLPSVARAHPELVQALLPTLRADLALCTSYRDDEAVVSCPIAAYSGNADPLLEPGTMAEWAGRTPEFLGSMVFPGDHFYLEAHAVAVATDFGRRIQRLAMTGTA